MGVDILHHGEDRLNKSTIVVVEVGMLLGVLVAALTVPRDTPLTRFLAISFGFLITGNLLLFRGRESSLEQTRSSHMQFRQRMIKVALLCSAYWLLALVERILR